MSGSVNHFATMILNHHKVKIMSPKSKYNIVAPCKYELPCVKYI